MRGSIQHSNGPVQRCHALTRGLFWADLDKLHPYQKQVIVSGIKAAREGKRFVVRIPRQVGYRTIWNMLNRYADAHPDLFRKR